MFEIQKLNPIQTSFIINEKKTLFLICLSLSRLKKHISTLTKNKKWKWKLQKNIYISSISSIRGLQFIYRNNNSHYYVFVLNVTWNFKIKVFKIFSKLTI